MAKAKEHSFDITAEIDKQELKNAIEQAKKEVNARYDFKGITANIDYNENAKNISLTSTTDNKIDAMVDMVISKVIKRGISAKAIKESNRSDVGGGNRKAILAIVDVISKEDAKKIVKEIKDLKLKVQAQIRGDEIRVTAKSIDDLQNCIKAIKEKDLDIPLNFINMT